MGGLKPWVPLPPRERPDNRRPAFLPNPGRVRYTPPQQITADTLT
jgi:hypothetical protein